MDYAYNPDGIRTRKHTWSEINDTHQNDDVTIVYLVDAYNHTGYAQPIEELTFYDSDPDPLTDTPDSLTTYTIGDDIIAQNVDGAVDYLLYDGHGSTRQLANWTGSDVNVSDHYSYDGYGVLLQNDSVASNNPGRTTPQATNLLYTGEQFDTDAQQYYLRARYYNQNNGLFNRVDPYGGNTQDPQSLHKYLYCHNNPVNNIDPLGKMTLLDVAGTLAQIGRAIIKYYPILRVGLIVADVLAVINIVLKAITQGISSVTPGEWTELALITATAFFGGKVARKIAKSMIMKAVKIPASALGSFKRLKRFIQSKGIIVEVTDLIVHESRGMRVAGEFDILERAVNSRPIIYLYKGGHCIRTLIHEYFHYLQWEKYLGVLSRQDWQNFIDAGNNAAHFEAIAGFIGDVFSK